MSDKAARHPQYREAKSAAIRLLSHRARARGQLEERLRGKDLAAEAIEQALNDLERAGYIDDEAYASERIEALLRKSKRGSRALIHALIQEGLDRHLAERIVAERLEGEDLSEWAREVAMERIARMRGLDAETARRRLYGYLGRRGFDDVDALRAIDEALAELDEQ